MEGARGKEIVVVETQNVADLLDAGEQLTVVEGQQE
jgi:nitrate reductase NapAB chaperone NapD